MKQRPVAGPCSAGGVEKSTPVERMSATNVVAERIVLHLADIGAADPERGDADDGVGRRTAGDDARIDAGGVERLGAILVDQVHRALHHILGDQIVVVRVGQNVDQRIAQSQNLDRRAHPAP